MYKKIYLEITNNCNLNCSFCIKNTRPNKYMGKKEFMYILEKIKTHTKYLYFHILGEPLMHPNINEFINIASKNFKVNITTNGYLINRIKNNKNIRQINISLHSFNKIYNKSLIEYMNDIFDTVDLLKKNTYISYRFWVNNQYTLSILNMINKRYNKDIKIDDIKNNYTIEKNVFISVNKEFIWPDLKNDIYSEFGTCNALKDHIGILVNGDIVPCCLDTKGIIKLGNIFKESLEDVKKTEKYNTMLKAFKDNKKSELLCKKCSYLNK